MNWLKILNKNEKREIENQLKKQFGISKVPGIIVQRGEGRLFLFTGDFNKKQIKQLENMIIIERLGIYFARTFGNEVRLSIEGAQALKSQIKKNIFSLDSKQAEEWMKGQELPVKTGKHGFLAMKYKDDFLGTGKASEEKIGNFIPKSRRLKNKEN